MTVALDLGTHSLRSLRRQGDRLAARRCQAEYLVLDELQQVQHLLDLAQVAYARCEGSLMLLGDVAAEYSPVFGVPCVPLFPQGRIPKNDPPARQALAAMVDSLLPDPAQPNEICCMTISGTSVHDDSPKSRLKRHEFLSQVVALRGYRPVIVNSSTALVLAELAADSFTGMGFSFGAGSCSASLVRRGSEIAHVSVPAAGDWIDMELARRSGEFCFDRAGNRHLDAKQAGRWKESVTASVLEPSNDRERFLGELVRELISHVVRSAGEEFSRATGSVELLRSLPVVIGGGTARLPAFQTLFERIWDESQFPLQAKSFRLAADSEHTVARGCLIRAELEAPSLYDGQHAA